MSRRREMVREIKDVYRLHFPKVLAVMLQVPREKFAPKQYQAMAYEDQPVPIGYGQTMSQPYTVAFMTSLVHSTKNMVHREKILEIGTGSGYQAAVLAKLFDEVYTVEIVPQLARQARNVFSRLGYKNIKVKTGSGEDGWTEHAPYDAVVITADIRDKIPRVLFKQLKTGGVLVAPVRGVMTRITQLKNGKTKKEEFGEFSFVPFVRRIRV